MLFQKRRDAGWLIVGLGNPGKKYERTRHNVGFRALDAFAAQHGIRVARAKFEGLWGEGTIGGIPTALLKPLTFMNLSGSAVSAGARYYKLPPARILVLCDDVALAPGIIRIRDSGSAGGHNGLRSIIDRLNSEDFPRLRIGVGEKPRPEYDLADWVLASPPSAEQKLIDSRAGDICAAIELIITGKLDLAQSRYNG